MGLYNILKGYHLLDLTHPISSTIPTWDLNCGFELCSAKDYPSDGIRVQSIRSPAGVGTHMDAPSHFVEGGQDIDTYAKSLFILKAAVIDVRDQVENDQAYFVAEEDIVQYETTHEPLTPDHILLINTGWSHRWPDKVTYRNEDKDGQMVFPGVGVEAAALLIKRGVRVLGIDTLSPDGINMSFPFHRLWLGAGNYILENLNLNMDLPQTGAIVTTLPIPIEEGTEAPTRVVALINSSDE